MVQQNASLAALLDAPENPFGEFNTPERLTEIEQRTGIWTLHPTLTAIHDTAAYSGRLSAWGLLVALLSRTSGSIPPHVVLVDPNGRPGSTVHTGASLSYPTIFLGSTGDGKGLLTGLMDETCPARGAVVTMGTGQGLAKSFAENRMVTHGEDGKRLRDPYEVRLWHSRSVSQEVDEFEGMRAEFERAGSQTLPMLRSLTQGKRCGMTNGDKTRTVMLPPHTYRFTTVYVTQPENLDTLMAYYKGGDPQRFTFAPVREYRPRIAPSHPVTIPRAQHPMLGTSTAAINGGVMINTGSSWDEYPTTESVSDEPYVHDPVWVHWSPQMHTDIPTMRAAIDSGRKSPYRKAGTARPDEVAAETAALVRSHMVLATIKTSAMVTALLGVTTPADTATHMHMTDLAWTVAQSVTEVSMGELAGCFEAAVDSAIRQDAAASKRQGRGNKIARDAQVEAQIDGAEQAMVPSLSALIRLRADNPEGTHSVRDVARTAGRMSSTEARDALDALLTTTEFGGVVAVERIGKRYRATDEIMRADITVNYLDTVRPGWDRTPFEAPIDPTAAFNAVVAGVGA